MIIDLTINIKHVLSRLIEYSVKWKQPINFKKTQWTLFHRQVAPLIPTLVCDEFTIEHVKKFKYLETVLDTKLSFNEHLDYIKNKIHSN